MMDDELLPGFLSEAEDLLEAIHDDVEALRGADVEWHARRELIARIFRHIHTLKGSAATAGLDSASEIAHACETLLDGVRLGRVRLDAAVLDAFDAALDAVEADLNAAGRGAGMIIPRDVVARLRELSSTDLASSSMAEEDAATTDALMSLPEDVARSLGKYERRRIRDALVECARLFVIEVEFDLTNFDERLRALHGALALDGEVISTTPRMNPSVRERVAFRLVYAARFSGEQLMIRLSPFGATLLKEKHAPDVSANGAVQFTGIDAAGGAAGLSAANSPRAVQMRVRADELDELILLTRDLRADFAAALDDAKANVPAVVDDDDDNARAAPEDIAARFGERLRELEDKLKGLRMVTLRRTLERAVRVGRAVARAAGREVEFEIAGGEVRLERVLAEALAGPLLHLLSNAVDHGIEPPEERIRLGKFARGRVLIEAAVENDLVVLRVTDDGRGVDEGAVARVAARRGFVGPDDVLTETEALRVIFRQGFSTAHESSVLSGRGVGLDVVERVVLEWGGELRVSSVRGAGVTFEMRFPTHRPAAN